MERSRVRLDDLKVFKGLKVKKLIFGLLQMNQVLTPRILIRFCMDIFPKRNFRTSFDKLSILRLFLVRVNGEDDVGGMILRWLERDDLNETILIWRIESEPVEKNGSKR